jgi:hypothetical protein
MGCDIHFFVEVRDAAGNWQPQFTLVTDEDEGEGYLTSCGPDFYSVRNYALFSILADVRNYGGCFKPISEARGVPEDASDSYKQIVKKWDGDGHSHSFFTVSELMAYDWTQVIHNDGLVDVGQWAEWKRKGSPDFWAEVDKYSEKDALTLAEFEAAWKKVADRHGYMVAYPGSALIGEDMAAKFARLRLSDELGANKDNKIPRCQIQWDTPYLDYADKFLAKTMPKLWALGKPEDVRIVFFFDN